MKYYVYIMTNKSNRVLYVGVTNNIERRVSEHRTGQTEGFTKQYHITKLVYAETFNDIDAAIRREKQIKGWVRSKKIELINSINCNWVDLMPRSSLNN